MKLQFFLFRLFLRVLRLTARLRRVLEFLFLFVFGIGEEDLEEGGEIYPYRLLNSEVFSLYKEPQAC